MKEVTFIFEDGTNYKYKLEEGTVLLGIRKGYHRPIQLKFNFTKDTELSELETALVRDAFICLSLNNLGAKYEN